MEQRKMTKILIGFGVLIVLVIFLLMQNGLRRSAHIVLPETRQGSGDTEERPAGGETIVRVEVRPDTVQSAIATLQRPDSYCRTLTVENIWSGGSATTDIRVSVDGGYTRTDGIAPGGQTRHAITDGETTWIWYDNAKTYYTGAAGDISSDDEQHIPGYEDILQLETQQLAVADYRSLSNLPCIYVETAPDATGYALRYWVSVENGLLAAAEQLVDGEAIYRMASLALDAVEPTTENFTLPDGTVLHEVKESLQR
ncbi:MAG: hypothetical protein RR295_10440 [Oscillospiraceae bacterium]